MGHTGSSSRRKHSTKKGYRKKKSRSKPKKIRHRDDSSSSCSDDECTSLSLDSSSSSEGEYRSKRARSRSRSEVKSGKKRSRRRYSSEDSTDDSLPVKKRKRSKKSKKIKRKKKSSKRDGYVSSASSDSGSCSTCKDEDDSSGEMGSRGRSRGRSREKRKGRRDSTTGRVGKRKNKSEARRSVSPSSSYGSERIENVTMENNSVRLKSVITVANVENEEDDNMKNDELKEEIVYDYDDYPSSKSNDSVELGDRVNSSPDKGSVVKEVNSGANLGDDKEIEGNVSGNIGSEADDLESILRQKALENLSRFRGGIKTKPVVAAKPVVTIDDKPKSDQSDVKQPADGTVSTTPVSQTATDRSRFTWRRDPSAATGKDEKAASYSDPHSSGPRPAELKLQTSRVGNKSVNEKPTVDNKFVNEKPTVDNKFVNEKPTVDNKFVNEKSMVDTNNVDQKSTAVVETPSASKNEGSSKEQLNESNDNSQFEKKTMSVMRGGEMVQVSYKVYIPNKAPALARRQLKR